MIFFLPLICLLLLSHVCPPLPLLLLVVPFFPFVASISPSLPVPGDDHLTPGTRSQRMHTSPTNAVLAALRLASCRVPSLVPVALPPKGNSHQRQWAAYQCKQQPAPCQAATKEQTREKRRKVQIWYNTAQEQEKKQPQYTKPSQTHPSQRFRCLESTVTQSHSQYVIVAPAASLI